MHWTLKQVAAALCIDTPSGNAQIAVTSVVTDSRKIEPGCLFIALKGINFDGHEFVERARELGAVAALVEAPVASDLPQLVCPDTRLALGLLAGAHRSAWHGPLVAVTGNSGKTTVKEMCAALLTPLGEVLATEANLNNDFGAPLTLLRLCQQHKAAVIELGANHLGEIAWTAPLARPDIAIITNVTGAHVGEFGGMGQIAQAKSELLAGLCEQGAAILNRDDDYYSFWASRAAPRRVVSFGFHPQADVSASALSCDPQGRYAFTLLQHGQALGQVRLPLLGKHNVSNALAAAAAALALGVSPEQLIARLESLQALAGRLTVVPGLRGAKLLDDTYNANPGAVKAALDTLASFPAPRWCALGAMGELGDESAALHADIGRYAAELGIDELLTLGDAARAASEAFSRGLHFNDHEALTRHVTNTLPPDTTLLVKGSRSAGMEHVVNALRSDN
ncbi:UDP-N-acetylmuramoyl-tripeptide--D-alanyl-D-alanine ligase [Vreelandella boliviensis]|uniref:UDP-N-acetylmuramoyl-tripeptide--D-alanyl-D-alanine ligase n=1 Tax=Vreelandella boliviensis LC1 TaxID=1072583 RepID=A0A265DXF2_9GAMM|nr:UDP-N-acetylmuramoyl-tripeptide--D-alanyl-D-alanine ligase [Halomonas boliviensis]EHJ91351.1 UDP-N-acetylmuramoyl-tripeptide--D-alanyl-D-alanine ligase [Halomonas boliviensis LC1]OZT74011.1 UDP-N-acetylmuramoyl-tripeptide--D-alanyl-D-alanine ligase [Halomonas boliviensis LC1]